MTEKYIKVTVRDTVDDTWKDLEGRGLVPMFSEQTANGDGSIYLFCADHFLTDDFPYLWEEQPAPNIDWEAQWQTHAPGFERGVLKVPITGYGDVLLKPGPGFGDLSHPTTRLMLAAMPEIVKGRAVIDIGCGSGVLSLCAFALGARPVHGVDISADALQHCLDNRSLNQMHEVTFSLPDEMLFAPDHPVVLMNMIESEQIHAWPALPQLHAIRAKVLTSGILTRDEARYLKLADSWGWSLEDAFSEGEWSAYLFSLQP